MNSCSERVAAIVVTYNSAPLLPDLFASLPAGFAGIPWDLVVVDNASVDNSVEMTRQLAPQATVVVLDRNGGYAAGINAGVRAAGEHTAVLLLNPDVRLGPSCVPELIRALREPGTGIAVPRLVDAQFRQIESMRREPTVLRAFAEALLGARTAGQHRRLGEMVSEPGLYEVERLTDWAEGSTQLVSALCWDECGSWDESFFLYSEETEFGLRARDAGFATRYVPSARAVHLEGDSAHSPPLWALLVINRVGLFRRRNGVIRTVPFWIATFIREARRAAAGRAIGRAGMKALLSPGRFREMKGPQSLR